MKLLGFTNACRVPFLQEEVGGDLLLPGRVARWRELSHTQFARRKIESAANCCPLVSSASSDCVHGILQALAIISPQCSEMVGDERMLIEIYPCPMIFETLPRTPYVYARQAVSEGSPAQLDQQKIPSASPLVRGRANDRWLALKTTGETQMLYIYTSSSFLRPDTSLTLLSCPRQKVVAKDDPMC